MGDLPCPVEPGHRLLYHLLLNADEQGEDGANVHPITPPGPAPEQLSTHHVA